MKPAEFLPIAIKRKETIATIKVGDWCNDIEITNILEIICGGLKILGMTGDGEITYSYSGDTLLIHIERYHLDFKPTLN